MGKYIRKPNLTNRILADDISQSTLGVRTRAKTLAIQSTVAKDSKVDDYCYLQLRSRRLQKLFLLGDSTRESSGSGQREEDTLIVEGDRIGLGMCEDQQFGENHLDSQSIQSGAIKSNPLGYRMDVDTTVTPPSAMTSPISSAENQRQQNAINIPSKNDIDEFFAFSEMQQELLFIERYNFDVKNDKPLSGRYEWVKISQ